MWSERRTGAGTGGQSPDQCFFGHEPRSLTWEWGVMGRPWGWCGIGAFTWKTRGRGR